MLTGFEKIIESRIKKAQRDGLFDNLPGAGKPLVFEDDRHVPEDLRLAYKMLKNADFVPPEVEIKKEIRRMEDMMVDIYDMSEKYRAMKRVNFLIMKFNAIGSGSSIKFDMPQHYSKKIIETVSSGIK